MVTTDLSQCLISSKDGIVSSFLNLKKDQNDDLEKCRIAKIDKVEKEMIRVHFLLEPGSIQVIKDIPSTLPFFIPDKGWCAFSPDKCKERYGCKVTKLNCRDIVYFKKEENVPSGPNRGSLHQRMKSTMFDDHDFCTTNLVYPECSSLVCQEKESVENDKSDTTKSKHNLMDHILNANKADKQFARQSKRDEGQARREDIMINRKMKRSIPGDFRSSVEAGRTPKHSIKPIRDEKEVDIAQASDNESSEESDDQMSDENNETTTDNTLYPNNNTPIKNHFDQAFYPISKELFPSENDALLWYLTKSPATPVYRRVISKQPGSVVTVVKTAKIPAFCSKTDSFPHLPSSIEEDEPVTSPVKIPNVRIARIDCMENSGTITVENSETTVKGCPKVNLLERFNQNNEEKRNEVKRGAVSSNKMSFRLNPSNKECNATQNSINALRMSTTNLHGNVL